MPRKGNAAPTPCPSIQGFWRHKDNGEEPCEGCRQARRDYDRARRPAPTRFLGPGECGTIRGYRWHRKQNEQPCQQCKDAIAEDRRGHYGKAVGTRKGAKLAPCGTDAAYERHLDHGETPCAECRAAHSETTRIDNQARRIVAAMARELAA